MKRRPIKVEQDCPECGGLGFVHYDVGEIDFSLKDCPTCHGSGKVEGYAEQPEFEPEEND